MEYITAAEAAKKWNISPRAVQLYCTNGKIPGVVHMGRQWLIPIDAQKPVDGRSVAAKRTVDIEAYHFPCLAATRYYSAPTELSAEERVLLEAQIHSLCGRLVDSVDICRRLSKDSSSPSVKFGAYYTNATNYFVLGCTAEYSSCVNAMENLCREATAHQEDYRLLINHLVFNCTFSHKAYAETDISRLSPDALVAYECFMFQKTVFEPSPLTVSTINILSAMCKSLEDMGIAPLAFSLHGMLASHYSRLKDKESQLKHIDELCQIGHKNGFLRFLSKYSSLSPDDYRVCLSKYGSRFANDVEKYREMTVKRVARARYYITGDPKNLTETGIMNEYALLISFNMSNKEIAVVKNIPEKEVQKSVRELCKRLDLNSRKELVKYCSDFYLPEN